MILPLMLAICAALIGQSAPPPGSISGVVINGSKNAAPVAGAEIVLRVLINGDFVNVAEGTADDQGRFVFDNIPADEEYVYLPGANRFDVHYPGPRIRLSARKPHARLDLIVHDTVVSPNPLVIRRHQIELRSDAEGLRVTESLLIENPGSQTWVGRPKIAGGRAATLQLSIPSDFRRITFQKEFYGRQFTVIDNRLVTDIPWTPGKRQLNFTYVVPNTELHRSWDRPLDLPTEQLRVDVHTDTTTEVDCNLPGVDSPSTEIVAFESTERTLPAGHVVRIQLGRGPLTLAFYGRWLALIVLVGLICTTSLIGIIYRRAKKESHVGKCQSAVTVKRAA